MKNHKSARTASSKVARRSAGTTVWEYEVVRPLDRTGLAEEDWGKKFANQLSDLGGKGWELCAQTATDHLVFKRAR